MIDYLFYAVGIVAVIILIEAAIFAPEKFPWNRRKKK